MRKAKLAPDVDADAVTMDDFNNAIERIVAGLEKRYRLLAGRRGLLETTARRLLKKETLEEDELKALAAG